MRLSIIITNYNYEAYLPRLFDSLAQQTCGLADTEIIFLDDASTDDSVATAEALAPTLQCATFQIVQAGGKRHPAIVRNKGFARAKGSLLFYIDADDFLAPTFLERCLNILDTHPAIGLAYTGHMLWNASQPDVSFDYSDEHATPVILPAATPALLTWQNVVTSPAMFRRQVWEKSRGFQPNTAYEDWDFWVQAVSNGFSFHRVEEPLYFYQQHPDSFSDKAEREDAVAKAQIVANSPAIFHQLVRKWAQQVLHNMSIDPFPRGIIPLPKDALDLFEK